jgi:thiosulfate/3-mercaptopyruvate sulfurtransferase
MLRKFLAVLVISTALAASATAAKQQAKQSQSPANMLVQTSWLASHLSDKNLVILHVGANRATYNAGHISGARFLALSDIAVTRNGIPNELPSVNDLKAVFERLGIGDHSNVVLYGDTLGLFAARAYFTLDYLGHGSSAALLDGGLEKWSKEHGTVQTATGNIATAVFTVRPQPSVLIEYPAVRDAVSKKSIPLIDARPRTDFAGASDKKGSGHIPGAKNVFWQENLVSKENPVFQSVSEIRAKYVAAGIKPGAQVIVYCHSGVQATQDYFTLKLAGFRPVLYDGSFADWSSQFNAPIETGI